MPLLNSPLSVGILTLDKSTIIIELPRKMVTWHPLVVLVGHQPFLLGIYVSIATSKYIDGEQGSKTRETSKASKLGWN